MDKIILPSEGIQGNIGDCKVNTKSYKVSSFTVETTAIDSCTGNIVAQNQYFDMTWLAAIPVLILAGVLVAVIFD